MTARTLDGKATAAAIKSELKARVSALAGRGITPGLGTLLVGEDPGSVSYVAGKHRDCAEVGIASIREDLPADAVQDPMHVRSGGVDPGRDGCRVPLPWDRTGTTFGFGPEGGAPAWLPQPGGWGELSVEAQAADDASVLTLYRRLLATRRREPALRGPDLRWLAALDGTPLPDDVLAFARGDVACVVNLGAEPLRLPPGAAVVLTSAGDLDDHLPTDTAAWLRL